MDSEVEKQIEDLVSDREKFNKFVYTPVDEAVCELEKRSWSIWSRIFQFQKCRRVWNRVGFARNTNSG